MGQVEITLNPPVPERSRTFSPDNARQIFAALKGELEQQNGTPAERVGFGLFDTPGAARSAGVTLNRLLGGLGADHKYAVTTAQENGKYRGIMLNRQAKERPAKKSAAASTSQRRK